MESSCHQGVFVQPESSLVLLDRTDAPQIEMVSLENTPKQREELGDPFKTLPSQYD